MPVSMILNVLSFLKNYWKECILLLVIAFLSISLLFYKNRCSNLEEDIQEKNKKISSLENKIGICVNSIEDLKKTNEEYLKDMDDLEKYYEDLMNDVAEGEDLKDEAEDEVEKQECPECNCTDKEKVCETGVDTSEHLKILNKDLDRLSRGEK